MIDFVYAAFGYAIYVRDVPRFCPAEHAIGRCDRQKVPSCDIALEHGCAVEHVSHGRHTADVPLR